MKRLLFLSFIIIVTFCMTLMAYASTGIESVLAAVKSKITVPEDYTIFESSSHEFAGKTEWNFWWRTQEQNGKAANEISVTADNQGNIKRYYHFKDEYITSDTSAHFSKYDKSDARIFALRFVSKVCPELIDKIELNQYSLTPDITRNLKTARVSFYRIENKIPYYANYMNFVIDLDTSDVVEYECNWDYDLVFPAADEVITPQAARRAYEEDAGIELRYRMKMENNNKQAYLVYTTVDEEKMVDAITGEIINGSVYTIRRPIDIYARNEAEVLKDASKVTFTEQEILELNSIEKVMTISQAEEYVRSIPQLSISNDYTLKSSSFTKSDSRYLINLEFVKLPNKSSDELTDAERAMIAAGDYSYVRLTVDAANMDIVRLFQYNKEAERLDYKVLEHNAKSRVDDFIANYLKNKYINCRYKGVQKLDGGNTYKFDYICMLSGVPFEGNGITVYFDASIGIIKSIICNWQFNVNVEGAKDIISLNDGKNLIFKYAPMQLAYVNKINYNIENYISGEKPEVVLVYMLNPFIPKNILAKTGELVTNDANPFNIIQYKKFIDIEGHYAQEQIQKLSNNLIIDENGYYYPDASITQADFLKMLFAGIKGYKYDNITDLYSNAIRNKIISEEDKNPEAEIIREDAVVYFIRMLGLESVAQLKDIYLVEYSDTSNISKDKIGYIALAKGFKIIGDNPAFEPKKALTRADAAVMVYNYLNRNN